MGINNYTIYLSTPLEARGAEILNETPGVDFFFKGGEG